VDSLIKELKQKEINKYPGNKREDIWNDE